MDINIEKLIAKIRNTECVMETHQDHIEGLGFVDGVEWQLVATRDVEKAVNRTMHEDAFVPGRQDSYAGSNDYPKATSG